MGRKYSRDRRGRFASIGATSRGGRLTSSSGKRYKRQTMTAAAANPTGRLRKGQGKAAAVPHSNIRATGKLPRTSSNSIKRTTGSRRGPMGLKANAIRSYAPVTGRGIESAIERSVGRIIKEVKRQTKGWKGAGMKADKLLRRFHRQDTKTWLERSQKGIRGKMARIETSQFTGRMVKGVRDTISRRAARAAAVAARGRDVGAKAGAIYDRQLAFTGSGKPPRGKNSVRPGPRNTRGTPRRKRKRKS